MRRKFLAFSLALATALSAGAYMPQVLAAEKQTVNEEANMEADTKMPIIKDDTGTVTEEMKARLIAKFVKEFPDEDLSDFTVEYSSNDNSNFDNPSGDYRFNVFYKDILVYDEIGSNSRVFLGIRSDEDYEAVFKPEFVETCKGLELNNLIGEETAKQVLKDAHKLSDSDNCDIQLVIYNYLTTGMMGSDKADIAYKINMTDNYLDMEYVIDAHSGEIIKGKSSVMPSTPSQDKKYKLNEVTYLIHSDWAEVESCEVTVQGGKVVIPEEIDGVPVTKIGTAAFSACGIQEIVIPETVVEIGSSAFEGCGLLETIKLPDNLKKIKFGTFRASGIKEIVIPESVTEIEGTAFDSCSNLETITIPKNVKTIGKCAFSHSRLKEILVEDGNTYFSSVDGVLFNYDKTELIAYPGGKTETSYNIPESVKTISGGTYGGAFAGSLNLTAVNIPEGVEVIESNVFSICPKLLELKLPSTVQKLEEKAINTCLSLSAVYIPKSVTEIGEGVFERCNALTDVYYEGSEAEWNELVSKSNLDVEATVSYNSYSTEQKLPGDVNLDGEIGISDVVMLQKWLINTGDLTCWQNADLCEDGKINVFDLCLLKRKVMENMQSDKIIDYSILEKQWVHGSSRVNTMTEQAYFTNSLDEFKNIIEKYELCENGIKCSCQYHDVDNCIPEKINEEFFKDKTAIVVYSSCGSSDRFIVVDKIKRQQKSLTIYTTTKESTVSTPDMAYHRFILAVDCDMLQDVNEVLYENTSSIYDRLNENEYEETCKWYSEWLNSKEQK